MKKNVAVLLLALTLLSVFVLAGCGYASKYKAVGFVHSNTSETAKMSFFEFEGKMVFKLNNKGGEGQIAYTGSLGQGDLRATYVYNGIESGLFPLKSGEEIDSTGGYVENGTVYIIVETNAKCENGSLEFRIDHQ